MMFLFLLTNFPAITSLTPSSYAQGFLEPNPAPHSEYFFKLYNCFNIVELYVPENHQKKWV